MTTAVSPSAEALDARAERARDWLAYQLAAPYQFRLTVAAERLWNERGVEALQTLRAGEVDVAAEVERDWP
jgi:hypothetical protein